MIKYVIASDASPPHDYEGPPSYVYRDSRDVMVVDSSPLEDTGLLNHQGGRILRTKWEIGFGRND